MNDRKIRALDMFKRVRVFNQVHPDTFGPGSVGRELFGVFSDTVEALEEYATRESLAGGLKRQNSTGRRLGRKGLHDMLDVIERTSHSLPQAAPGTVDKFKHPRSCSDQTLLNVARAIAQELVPLKADFIKLEMPPTFIEDLLAAIADLEKSIGGQHTSKGARRLASASIDGAVEQCMDAVRRLDPIIRNKFAAEPAVVAEWESARHIERNPRSKADGGGNNNNGGGDNNLPPTT